MLVVQTLEILNVSIQFLKGSFNLVESRYLLSCCHVDLRQFSIFLVLCVVQVSDSSLALVKLLL